MYLFLRMVLSNNLGQLDNPAMKCYFPIIQNTTIPNIMFWDILFRPAKNMKEN